MRIANHGTMGSKGLASFLNSYGSGSGQQDNLISIMNKASKQKNSLFTSIDNASATINNLLNNVNSDKGVYDSKTGTWSSSGNQTEALQTLKDRQSFNQTIQKALKDKGIQLSDKEKMTLTVDQDGKITVSGINDASKKAKIEEALNSALGKNGATLLMHIESVKVMNGKETPMVLDKWMVYDFLKKEAGQNLNDLKLVDGKIVGANEKLQQILNGEVDFGKDQEYAGEVIAKLKSVLAYGVDKIPDLKLSIDYQNGSLNDIDVTNGFGTTQLKSWFSNFVSGQSAWDMKA